MRIYVNLTSIPPESIRKPKIFQGFTAWKLSKYRVFSGPYFPVVGPEKTPYLDTSTQWFESRWMSVKFLLVECFVKTVIVFYKLFYEFFCRRHYLMNQPCYNNLFQVMQRDNFLVIFKLTNDIPLTISWNWFQFQENGALLKYCSCFIHGVIKV